jgi:predicted nucleotidyltransferase component of viral defense system
VRYATAGAFRAALEARLKDEQSDGVGLSRLRKRIVFERLLARLQVVAPDGWLLKGGFALELRLGGRARTTKDVDIDWTVGEGEATELLLDAAALEMDDMFSFDVQRAATDDDLAAGGGQRWTVRAELAGRDFERVAIDVGFGKPPVVEPVTLTASGLLEFAEIPAIAVPALAVEQHLAEKLHAYSRTYAAGQPSSRVKDLVDIVVIARTTTVDGDRLRQAVAAIFERRDTHEPPPALASPPRDWARPWATLVDHLPADADLASGFSTAAAFWDPVLASEADPVKWDPELLVWSVAESSGS